MAQVAQGAGRTLMLREPPVLPRRDRIAIGASLLALAALAWAFTARQAAMMEDMDHANMRVPGWSLADAALLMAMWVVMMVAMMTPSVAPMTTAFATINRRRRERKAPHVATAVFVAGYLLAWVMFSAVATVAQLGLHAAGLLDAMMVATSNTLSAALLLIAGLYQWSPLKDTCLARCRSAEGFILSEWREGILGAVVMGWRHGLFCIGCCALLMALLFAGSVMDLRWVAGLTAIVLVEKLGPNPTLWRRLIGIGLIAAGAVLAFRSLPS